MDHLYDLLDAYISSPAEELPAAEARIWNELGVERAAFVLDMSGFSRLVRRFGIVHYLAMIRRMQKVTRPIVQGFGGEHLKYEADNLFAVFPRAEDAVGAALAVVAEFRRLNEDTDDARDIHVSIGIDVGRVLLVPGTDMFGDAVNVASKLGEDVAERDEILVTAKAMEGLVPDPGWKVERRTYSISGLSIEAYAVSDGV
ncbi:putative adenylate/guanylate cyclase [Hyaloraphidium curvatum]|nr:putative adenylate/guanylate cyclase [Hyaloraphidium curvatum]